MLTIAPFSRIGYGLVGLLALIGLAACSAVGSSPSPTAGEANPLADAPRYTHPSGAFSLALPADWQVVEEDAIGVRLEPVATAAQTLRWAAAVVTHTGVALEDDALRAFARQFTLDACTAAAQAAPCVLDEARQEDQGTWEVMAHRGEHHAAAEHIWSWSRAYDNVVYTLMVASQGEHTDAQRLWVEALWHTLQARPEAAQVLPLYGRHSPYRLALPGPQDGHLVFDIPWGWAVHETAVESEHGPATYLMALSPSGALALYVYAGMDSQAYQDLRDAALYTLDERVLLQNQELRVYYQHLDLEGRWILTWKASPPNLEGLTVAAVYHDQLVLLSGVSSAEYWVQADPFFSDLVLRYTFADDGS